MYQKNFKKLFDITISLFLIISLSPLMIAILFLISFFIGYPIYKQKRPGLNNKIFTIYKFKTLYDNFKTGSTYERHNRLGNFLRKTGLDELPQLFNVLNNDMSLVGPRPLLIEYLNKYSDYENKRHLVKPGITGLAQVYPSSTGNKNWKNSIRLDVFYVKNITFSLDLLIIFKTIKIIFTSKKQYRDFKKSF